MRFQEYVTWTALTRRKENYSFFLWATRLCATPEATGGKDITRGITAIWDWLQMQGLGVCGESNYKVSRNTWGTQLLKLICWICEMTSNILQKEKGSKVPERGTFQRSNPFVDIACSLLLAVMFNIHYVFPGLNWTVSLKVNPIYPLQIFPAFWVSVSLLKAQKVEFWAKG